MAADQQITEVVDFNPPRPIKRGAIAPFVDMAALPENQRDIAYVCEREFSGGGSRFQNGDTLFARITPCLENGKTAKVNSLPAGSTAHGSTEFIVMAAKAPEYDEDYVYYLARHPDFRAFAEARMEGTSGRQRVSWQALSDFSFPFPSSDQRKVIGSILRKIDDKIHLNRRINQTLEAMAQAIFKSWFVDFDPVKAKIAAIEQGQDPLRAAMRAISGKTDAELDQMPSEHHVQLAATAALFPDAMEESVLGEIPKGWSIKSVSDLARFATGKIEVLSLTVENYISTENMLENRGGISRATSIPAVATVPTFKSGNVLISNIRPYFKKIWLARFDGGRSNDVLCFEAKEKGSEELLYNLLYQDDFFEFMMRTSKGAKMPRGDKDAIAGWTFPCASPELRCAFSEIVRPFYSHIENLNLESQRLSELRDTLLPKLLSGELSAIETKEQVTS